MDFHMHGQDYFVWKGFSFIWSESHHPFLLKIQVFIYFFWDTVGKSEKWLVLVIYLYTDVYLFFIIVIDWIQRFTVILSIWI